MYLKYIPRTNLFAFLNEINGLDVMRIDCTSTADKKIIKCKLSKHIFHITDFDCVDVTSNKSYISKWRQFMVEELDKVNPKLANKYIDDFYNYVEEDTIVGPAV